MQAWAFIQAGWQSSTAPSRAPMSAVSLPKARCRGSSRLPAAFRLRVVADHPGIRHADHRTALGAHRQLESIMARAPGGSQTTGAYRWSSGSGVATDRPVDVYRRRACHPPIQQVPMAAPERVRMLDLLRSFPSSYAGFEDATGIVDLRRITLEPEIDDLVAVGLRPGRTDDRDDDCGAARPCSSEFIRSSPRTMAGRWLAGAGEVFTPMRGA